MSFGMIIKTKIWWNNKIMSYGHRHLYCIHKDRWYLSKHCRKCWNKVDSSNYESDRPLPKGKNKKVIGLMKDESGGKIMIEFVGLRAKT